MHIKTILVPTDFSENARNAFDRACDLARQTGASIHLLHVQEESTLRTAVREDLLGDSPDDEAVEAAVNEFNQRRLSEAIDGADHSGIHIESLTRRGDSKVVIIDYAREVHADITVVGRRGMSLIERVVGSIAESIIRKSPCPVLVVRRDHN
jgi:nucleotide-binding universal stress UspA family protein